MLDVKAVKGSSSCARGGKARWQRASGGGGPDRGFPWKEARPSPRGWDLSFHPDALTHCIWQHWACGSLKGFKSDPEKNTVQAPAQGQRGTHLAHVHFRPPGTLRGGVSLHGQWGQSRLGRDSTPKSLTPLMWGCYSGNGVRGREGTKKAPTPPI